MNKRCILVDKIWEFTQHSQTFRHGWTISLSFYMEWICDNLKITTERSGYKTIKSHRSLSTQQISYDCTYLLHLLNILKVYFLDQNWSQRALFLPLFLSPSLSPAFLESQWGSGTCIVSCHGANLALRLC